MKKLHCYALCALLLFYFNHSQAQCTVSPPSSSFEATISPLDNTIQQVAQVFTSTCDGFLKQLTFQLFYRSEQYTLENINVKLYKGESPTDTKSELLYKVDNYLPSKTSDVVIDIAEKIMFEKNKHYYFTVSNTRDGSNLPNGLRYDSKPRDTYDGGLFFYESDWSGRSIKWTNTKGYVSDRIGLRGLDIMYTATVTPAINEPHTICRNNVFQILNYDSTNSTYKEINTDVFKLTVKGDTALVTALNYGMASFIYTKKNAPDQLYKCEIAVTIPTAPGITASKNILTNVNDTATLKAESSTNMAMRFDGTKYLSIPNNNGLQFSNGFTFEAWIRCDDAEPKQYLFFNNQNGNGCGVYIQNGKILFENNNNGSIAFTSNVTYRYRNWTHIAVTYDGTNVKFYVNGGYDAVSPYSSSILNNQQDILLGVYQGTNNQNEPIKYNIFKGEMDDLRLWNVCRTEDEIKKNYQKAVLAYSKGLVAYYNFDRVVNNSAAIDESTNYNNADVNNCKANLSTGSPWIPSILDINRYTYLWNNNATRPQITVINPDTYFYNRTDLLTGCTTESQEVKITQPNK